MIKYEILLITFIIIITFGIIITFFLKIRKLKIWYAFLISWFIWFIFNLIFPKVVNNLEIANMQDSYYKDILFTVSFSFFLEPIHHILTVISLVIIIYHKLILKERTRTNTE